jgi:tetratricopeptide (TPR) repeat protein
MRSASGTGGKRAQGAARRGAGQPVSARARVAGRLAARRAWAVPALLAALALGLGACSSTSDGKSGAGANARAAAADKDAKTILLTRKGESSIQVTESQLNGDQIVRINTVFRGEENSIVLDIDQPVYEVEIPLSLEQVLPQAASAQVRGPEGQFQDLLIAQWLQKAQEAMMAGDYNAALRQVDTVLQIQPNHIQAHSMKGSVYYALGNYELANQEWEQVLSLDPSNQEVLEFKEFLKNRSAGTAPKLPGAPEAAAPPKSPPKAAAPRAGNAPPAAGGAK